MKKYMTGFVPMNYKKSGIILLIIGLAGLVLKLISYFTSWFFISNYLMYFGPALILISFYLILVVPKE
ncbi:MAG: hypothetical protein COV55_01605 [Candidatus Komeilibacteria bacterium CG11_big_fil_rev_8_21_14_0_20_36_20]|uniref:DUF3098 domain-containing protein n=1 Tax=Candidatus Komeilibacteria bacterium CG11_big_fil_rev_8_21_14_0_20_36_20 TaxID=1974477 RepID=A0A2H0NGA5_9BACT|nr:MAG: hypothetical protein COV55_01605 [Candidatus Komeilibacteria bacterium CG11_big_fil_rev_8_21_14_0_20_36_20]PIR81238.1 MAG: hypothetical protein COU21_04590 [Candidatus Komeilibacteria bacterium CG10_big_fil_rev_8_21_14_0_10_36_65]PJC55202.1 MAG: hypothetical protein CO027_03530 [Candidatus Komeilibacteria bacterium CG_4_9_14_0_2_um_filter_36_13]